jgi:hypothetical protein
MEHVRAMNRQFVSRLLDSLPANLSHYTEGESWVEEWAGDTAWDFPTPCEFAMPLELLLPEGENFFDLQNSIRIHKALPNLTPVQAQDPRLWTHLAHVDLWDYMQARWPGNRYTDDQKNIRWISSHYFVAQKQSRALVRNGVARLWWASKMTCDPSRNNPYELTAVLFSQLDIFKNLLEHNFGRAVSVTRAFLEFMLLNKEQCLGGGSKPRQLVRDLSKAVNLHGGVCVLDCKSTTALLDFLNREKDRLVSKYKDEAPVENHDEDEEE